MSEQDGPQVFDEGRPTTASRGLWRAYWKEQGQLWRIEPEINEERQRFLAERYLTVPNISASIYPFKGVKLSRADVEWLLEYDQRRGQEIEVQQLCQGLDLRGADLCRVDLSSLPLMHMQGGLTWNEWSNATEEQRDGAAVLMKEANLREAHLEEANLVGAHLEDACLLKAHLEEANLVEAHLERARLSGAHLGKAYLLGTHLEGAQFLGSHLEKANLMGAYLRRARFPEAYLEKANLREAHLEGANLREAHVEEADLRRAYMEGAYLFGTHLERVNLREAHLERAFLLLVHMEEADLQKAHLEGAVLKGTHLEGANLRDAYLVGANLMGAHLAGARLENVHLSDERGRGPQLVDAHYDEVNLAEVNWSRVKMLGDEQRAQERIHEGNVKNSAARLDDVERAVRANRQLASALGRQGMREDALRFAYRAQKLQRIVLRRRLKVAAYIFSWILDLLTGYGYRPVRLLFWYLVVILGFSGIYSLLGELHLSSMGVLVFSVTAFHGRGLFPSNPSYDDVLTVLAAVEAIIGLLMEMCAVAVLVQKFPTS